jgi:hypothetical protein
MKGWFFSFKNLWYQKNWWKFPTKMEKFIEFPPKKIKIPNFVPIFLVEKMCWEREILIKISKKKKKNLHLMKLKLYSIYWMPIVCNWWNFNVKVWVATIAFLIHHIIGNISHKVNNVTHSHGYLNMTLLFKPKLNLLCKTSCQHMLGHINGWWCLLIMNHTKLGSKLT